MVNIFAHYKNYGKKKYLLMNKATIKNFQVNIIINNLVLNYIYIQYQMRNMYK